MSLNGKYTREERRLLSRVHSLKTNIKRATNPFFIQKNKEELTEILVKIGDKYKGSKTVRSYRYKREIKNEGCFFLYFGLLIYRLAILHTCKKRIFIEIEKAISQYHRDLGESDDSGR